MQRATKRPADASECREVEHAIQPESLNVVSHDGWEELEVTVDSGASETVVPEGMVNSVEVKEGPAAKSGVQYLGEKFVAHTQDGVPDGAFEPKCAR